VPPSPEVLKGVHDVVAGVTGFNQERGDQITIETLPFESTLQSEPPSGPAPPGRAPPKSFDFKQPVVIGVAAALLVVATGLFFVMSGRRRKVGVDPAQPGIESASPADAKGQLDRAADNEARQAQIEAEELSRIKLPPTTRKTEVLVKHIRTAVQKDSESVTNVLRTWIAEPETKRTS
jgi:flagellar M-ring protein FliF